MVRKYKKGISRNKVRMNWKSKSGAIVLAVDWMDGPCGGMKDRLVFDMEPALDASAREYKC